MGGMNNGGGMGGNMGPQSQHATSRTGVGPTVAPRIWIHQGGEGGPKVAPRRNSLGLSETILFMFLFEEVSTSTRTGKIVDMILTATSGLQEEEKFEIYLAEA